MNPAIGAVILCLAYIFGLLSAVLQQWGGYVILALGVVAAAIAPRLWRKGPKWRWWLMAGVVGLLATFYLQIRIPQPAANDVSNFVPSGDSRTQREVVVVRGKVESTPRLTRSQKAQFWLKATQLDEVVGGDRPLDVGKEVTGKLYVTVPLLQITGIYPGETIAVTGNLYKPKPPANPGSFNFQAYLAQEGAFAGFKGRQISLQSPESKPQWGWWTIRQRIIRSQVRWLGVPEGLLVGAMVSGNRTVDLPYDIKDNFVRIGLAHALAASGFQVSLILGVVLALTKRLPERIQFGCGVVAILIFLGLTGLQTPVLRAVVMGIAALFGLVMQRKVIPLGSLLVSATFLLLINPLWIRDLSFLLSFLATQGLLVTASALVKRLDWIPPLFASAIAIPIAASVWTIPLQLYYFNVVSPYSIIANVISVPLITVISIGGFISAIAALIWPLAGSALAWLLYYPTHWLIMLVEFFCQLPGNSVAVGTISVVQFVGLYVIILLVWIIPWFHKRWWVAFLAAIALAIVPVWHKSSGLFRVNVLATGREPVMVIQDRGQVTLINSGDANTARFTVLPFLRQEGINKIDLAIRAVANDDANSRNSEQSLNSGWATILESLPITIFYDNIVSKGNSSDRPSLSIAVQARQGTYQPLVAGQTVEIGSASVKLINAELPALQLQIKEQSWLLLGDLQPDRQKAVANERELPRSLVLWWSGQRLIPSLLSVLQPGVAIASSDPIDSDTAAQLRKAKVQLYNTSRNGAIQWTPGGKFETTLELTENQSSLL